MKKCDEIEVSSNEEGLKGSWFRAILETSVSVYGNIRLHVVFLADYGSTTRKITYRKFTRPVSRRGGLWTRCVFQEDRPSESLGLLRFTTRSVPDQDSILTGSDEYGSDHERRFELFFELANLDKDPDTNKTAMSNLRTIVKDLNPKALHVFLNQLSETKEIGSDSGGYTVSLFEDLARAHGVKISPHVETIMPVINREQLRQYSESSSSSSIHDRSGTTTPTEDVCEKLKSEDKVKTEETVTRSKNSVLRWGLSFFSVVLAGFAYSFMWVHLRDDMMVMPPHLVPT
ncbi:hypothetical protein DY000_02050898 [Brassica cretica]|uniref:Uncharacterized protein n=1 Tax=Brassica cretica TaxID=69181 RepID=A0ABQ7EY07_BRACR|nr:hypothetical protein DY000_02050898 [Brassica cretica]